MSEPDARSGLLGWLDPAEAGRQGDRSWNVQGRVVAGDGPAAAITGHPRWSEDDLVSISYEKGHAAALLRGYERHGEGVLEYINGDFACLVVDPPRSLLLAAIDRIGQHSLYYAPLPDGGVAVATGPQLLIQHGLASPDIDPQAIHDYLHFHVIPAPATLYRGMYKLRGAERLRLHAGTLDVRHYWLPQFSEATVDARAMEEALQAALRKAVEDRHQPGTGSFLSGGLDSSTVTGLHADIAPDTAHAYAIGFDAPGYDEIPFARTAANHFDVPLTEYYVTPADVAEAVPAVAQAYDEPFGNSSALPAYFCARQARAAGLSHLLAGDGGDELFAGNARYAKQQVFELYRHVPRMLRSALIEPLVHSPAGGLPGLRKARSYVEQAKTPLPDRMHRYSFLEQLDAGDMLEADFRSTIDPERPLDFLRTVYHAPVDASALNRMLYLDWQTTLADSDLRKVNRMCALAGVDVSYPMLDDPVIELSCRIPSQLKLRRGRLRHFYKEAFRGFLPPAILDKRKHGFGLPFGLWLRDDPELHELARESVLGLRDRGWFRPAFLNQLFERHLPTHPAYFGDLVWILMVLALWLEAHDIVATRSPAGMATALGQQANGHGAS